MIVSSSHYHENGLFSTYETDYGFFNWEDLAQDGHETNCQSIVYSREGESTKVYVFSEDPAGAIYGYVEVATAFYTSKACLRCTHLKGQPVISILRNRTYGNIAAVFPLDRPDKIAKAFRGIPSLTNWWNDFQLGLI